MARTDGYGTCALACHFVQSEVLLPCEVVSWPIKAINKHLHSLEGLHDQQRLFPPTGTQGSKQILTSYGSLLEAYHWGNNHSTGCKQRKDIIVPMLHRVGLRCKESVTMPTPVWVPWAGPLLARCYWLPTTQNHRRLWTRSFISSVTRPQDLSYRDCSSLIVAAYCNPPSIL